MREHIDRAIAVWNGTPGDPRSFDRLHALLDEQNYRLAYWRTASDEINYRRFFDVNELAGVRMEDPAVFEATHGLILRLIGEGKVTGLRVDHPDGLADPIDYVARLQAHVRDLLAARGGPRPGGGRKPFYVSIEKILSANEELPAPWAVHGTTTYSFLNEVNGLFVDIKNAVSMRRIYARLTGHRESFQMLMYHSKRFIMQSAMASELAVLAHALNDISESHRRSRDFTLNGLRKALTEVVACFPVYRTYVSARGASDSDRHVIFMAIARARRRNPAMESTIFDFIQSVLLPPAPLDDPTPEGEADRQRRLAFALKFQQYTGPVHAKGVEDTSFYRYNVLVSLNEVGGNPERFGRTPADFHEANRRRLERWPLEMIGTATHDTKRGEDVRARINVLSEMPEAWRKAVGRWTRLAGSARTRLDGDHAPDRNDEYLFYQTLIGTWPAEHLDAPVPREASEEYADRIRAYMRKAIKEAKAHTSWVNENQPYEKALDDFVTNTLRGATAAAFLAAFVPFQRQVARLGAINSLSQLVLRMTSPGRRRLLPGQRALGFSSRRSRQPSDGGFRRSLEDARRTDRGAARFRRAARELDRRAHQDVSRGHAAAAAARDAGAVAGRRVSGVARRRRTQRSSPRRVRAPARFAHGHRRGAAIHERTDAVRHALASDRLRRVQDNARRAHRGAGERTRRVAAECSHGRGGASARRGARGHAAGRGPLQNTAGSGAARRDRSLIFVFRWHIRRPLNPK